MYHARYSTAPHLLLSFSLFCLVLFKERFHVGNGLGHAVRWQAGEKRLPISLSANARVEQHEHSAIFQRPNEPPKTLLQREHRFGDLVVEEGLASGLFD